MFKSTITTFILLFAVCAAYANMLNDNTVKWGHRIAEGAIGTSQKQDDGSILLSKTSEKGILFFINENLLILEPGHSYKVTMRFQTLDPAVKGHIMVNMPGSKRRPFPVTPAMSAQNSLKTAELTFTAAPDEKQVRLHFVLTGGIGKARLLDVKFVKLPPMDIQNGVAVKWGFRTAEGAAGTMKRLDDNSFEISKTAEKGILFFINENLLPIKPGCSYKVSMRFQTLDPAVRGHIMVNMPGSKRRPFPVTQAMIALDKPQTSELIFTAAPDEKQVRLHFVVTGGIGRVRLFDVQFTEIHLPPGETTVWSGDSLKNGWMPSGGHLPVSSSDGVEIFALSNGEVCNNNLNWNAAEIKAVEVVFRAFEEGGFIKMSWTGKADGKVVADSLTRTISPDGVWQSVVFDVSNVKKWCGTISSVKFSWGDFTRKECRFGLKAVRALSEANVIAGANSVKPGNPVKIDMLKPRTEYALYWKGKRNPGLRLDVFDLYRKKLKSVSLNSNEKGKTLKVPALAAYGMLTVEKEGDGYPVLERKHVEQLGLPDIWWKASWIWSRNVPAPLGNVWFRKTFTLPAAVKRGEVIMVGDDTITLWVNGKEFSGGSDWSEVHRRDVTAALKNGENELTVKVFNGEAWGGMLLELYVETTDGKSFRILSDGSWSCCENGDTIPAVIDKKVFVFGQPPVPPWGLRVGCDYIGSRSSIQLKSNAGNSFSVLALEKIAVDTAILTVKITDASGNTRLAAADISPSSGNWPVGKPVNVRYNISEWSTSGLKDGKIRISLATPFLEASGDNLIGVLQKHSDHITGFPKSKMIGAGQRTWFEIDGKRYSPLYMDLPNYALAPAQKNGFIRNAVNSDLQIIRITQEMRKIWKTRDNFDFSELDRACLALLSEAPDARILLQLSTYMPPWWLKENPDDATAFYGKVKPALNNDFQSLASKKWLKDADFALHKLIGHMEKQKYGSRIIGIVPTDGSTFEWMWSVGRGHTSRVYSGYSPVAMESFRNFLRGKYQTDDKLAAAWKRQGATFAAIMPPMPARLDSASIGNMLDPRKDRDLMDWFEYRNKIVSDNIIALCGSIKKASGGKLLAGTYYGYLVMFSHMRFLLQEGGHLGIHKIAKSPEVDFVIGPTIYHWRRLGMSDSTMQPDGAFTCHGKPVICEFDYRTFSDPTDYERRNGKVDTVEQSASIMDFGFGMLLTRGLAGHYMELHDRWYLEPVLQQVIREQQKLYKSLPEKSAGLAPFDVCIVSDELSPMYVKNNIGDSIHVNLIPELFRRLREAGFAYRHVLLPDILEQGVLPAHKFYIMTNTMVLDSVQRKALLERFKRENSSVLWLYASGVFYPDAPPSAANVDEMTGMKCSMSTGRQPMTMVLEKPFGGKTVNHRIALGPWFPIIGGYEEVIGGSISGEVLAAGRKDGNRRIWFSTVPNLPPALLKELAKRAGVHIYSESDDPIRAGNDFVFIQAKNGGQKTIRTPNGCKLRGVIGPFKGTLESGQPWQAEAGRTYGFQLMR